MGIAAPKWVPIYRQELLEHPKYPRSYQHYLEKLDALEPILEELQMLLDHPERRSLPLSIELLHSYLDTCLESLDVLQQLIHRFQSDSSSVFVSH